MRFPHNKNRHFYDERFAGFWSQSYEAVLDQFARDSLACPIDERLHVPFEICESIGKDSFGYPLYYGLKFILAKTGRLHEWGSAESCGVPEFDKIAKAAFIFAAQYFPPLPPLSADLTEFRLQVSFVGVRVFPVLFDSQLNRYCMDVVHSMNPIFSDWCRNMENSQGKRFRIEKVAFGLIIGRETIIVDLLAGDCAYVQELAKIIENAISDRPLPSNFPDEIRFLVFMEHHNPSRHSHVWTDGNEYERSRWAYQTDALDARSENRSIEYSKEFARRELLKIEEQLQGAPNDVGLLHEAIKIAKYHDFNKAIQYCDEIIRLRPNTVEGYMTKAHCLHSETRRGSPSEYAEEILGLMYKCLKKTRRKHEKENCWNLIANVLAGIGKYRDAVEAYQHIDEFWQHAGIARSLEFAHDWKNAIKEWKLAQKAPLGLGHSEEKIKHYIRDCEEALADQEKSHKNNESPG